MHNFEYENSGLKIDDISKLIKEKRALYNYKVDQKKQKWSSNLKLCKISLDLLPEYIVQNKEKYRNWLEN